MGRVGLLFFILLTVQNSCYSRPEERRLSIDVYLETLCPDSYNFIKYQLYPAWSSIRDRVHVRFIPFGKSRSLGNGTSFRCQHGPRECEGNRMLICGLNEINDQDEQMQYVNCFMTKFKKARQIRHEFGQQCAYDLGLSWHNIRNCYESELGTELLLTAEALTKRLNPEYIPTIVYNGMFDQFLQDASLANFNLVSCTLLSKRFGVEC